MSSNSALTGNAPGRALSHPSFAATRSSVDIPISDRLIGSRDLAQRCGARPLLTKPGGVAYPRQAYDMPFCQFDIPLRGTETPTGLASLQRRRDREQPAARLAKLPNQLSRAGVNVV